MSGCEISHRLLLLSVVVDQFNVVRATVAPFEADAVLVIDADAVLSSTGRFQLLRSGCPEGTRRSLMFSAASRIYIFRRAAFASSLLIPFGR